MYNEEKKELEKREVLCHVTKIPQRETVPLFVFFFGLPL